MKSLQFPRPTVRLGATALFVLLSATLFGVEVNNGQKIYRYGSPEYEAIRTLYIETGSGLPFSSGPFSEAELRLALERIDPDELSEPGVVLYRWVLGQFEKDPDYTEEGRFAFDASAELSLESYVHTDRDNPFWEYGWEERKPLLNFPLEAWVTDHAYGVMELDFRKNIPDFSLYPTYESSRQILDTSSSDDPFFDTVEEDPFTNVFYDPLTLSVQFPHRAYMSVGGDRWNMQFGRDAVDWGNGRTGNLYISGYSAPHDYLRLSTFWRNFKFSALWVSLDPHIVNSEREFTAYPGFTDEQGTSYPADSDGDGEPDPVYEADVEQKSLIAHRFEVRLWDRLTLAATEGIVFGRDNVELRHFNPLYLYHNLYTNTRNIGNTHMSYEFDLSLVPGLGLYAAISPDQWSSPLEPETDIADEPNGIIYLAGLDYRKAAGQGLISSTLEGVYSTKWMYIHNHPLTSITVRRYIQAEHGVGRSGIYYDRPLGHYGGNDFALLWFDINYHHLNRYRFGLTTYYELDGENPINALLASQKDDRRSLTEAEATEQAPSGDNPQEKVVATLYGELQPWFWEQFNTDANPALTVGTEVSFQFMQNRFASVLPVDTTIDFAHDWKFDLQWVVSVALGW